MEMLGRTQMRGRECRETSSQYVTQEKIPGKSMEELMAEFGGASYTSPKVDPIFRGGSYLQRSEGNVRAAL